MDDFEAGAAPEMQDQQPQGDQGGYTVCIRVGADRKLSVGVERESAEAEPMEGQAGMPGPGGAPAPQTEPTESDEYAGFQPATTLKEALTMAMEIIRNDGQMPEDTTSDFDAGLKMRGSM